jgi:hypothetical protein
MLPALWTSHAGCMELPQKSKGMLSNPVDLINIPHASLSRLPGFPGFTDSAAYFL